LVTVTPTVSVASGEAPPPLSIAFCIGIDEDAFASIEPDADTRFTVAFQVLPEALLVTAPSHLLFPEVETIVTASLTLMFVPVTVPALF
jgi:hypothetical protein